MIDYWGLLTNELPHFLATFGVGLLLFWRFRDWRLIIISFLFGFLIDADHSYEMAKREFEFFFKKLVPGGVIFIHDTLPPHKEYLSEEACHDCYKLRQELETRNDEMDCFSWPYTAGYQGLTMVMKKDSERSFWEK